MSVRHCGKMSMRWVCGGCLSRVWVSEVYSPKDLFTLSEVRTKCPCKGAYTGFCITFIW